MKRTLTASIIGLFVLLAAPAPTRAEGWEWKSTFTGRSSPKLTGLHSTLTRMELAGPGYPVANAKLTEEGFELTLESGTIWLEPPVEGVRPGAYFEGKGTVSYTPTGRRGKSGMTYWFGSERLEPSPISRAYLFTVRDSDWVQLLALAGEPSVPLSNRSGYEECKRAFRQLGLSPVYALLNREGRSRGTTFAIFPLDSTRGGLSRDALMLYTFDPDSRRAVALSAGNHPEVDNDPAWRYLFHPLSEGHSASRPWQPAVRVGSYSTKLSMPKRLTSTDLETTIRFTPGEGVRVLGMALTRRLEVASVRGADGTELPFAQWAYLDGGPNIGELIVDLGAVQPANAEIAITVAASGKLFDAFLYDWVLADEDTWYPQFGDPLATQYEITIQVPKNLTPVAPGEKVSDVVADGVRTVRYRTTRPQQRSTLYIGPFEVVKGEVEGTKVEVYADRASSNEGTMNLGDGEGSEPGVVTMHNASKADVDYSRQEIENALKAFKGILGPIDLETLRVVGTPTFHGRGFEGLLLLSKFGGFRSDSSFADVFRAHEVAHMWWGNQIDVLDWREDRWLMESFAEYSAMEFYTLRFRDPGKTREQMRQKWVRPILESSRVAVQTVDGQKRRARASELRPLIDGSNNVYTKGPLVIHMLRNLFILFHGNDQKFWELLQEFLEKNKGTHVTTDDFIAATESKLGGKIAWFWDQWLYGSELPEIRWSSAVEQQGAQWLVTVNARQVGPKFDLALPVYVELGKGRRLRQFLKLSEMTGKVVIKSPEKPKSVSVNDDFEVLAIIEKE